MPTMFEKMENKEPNKLKGPPKLNQINMEIWKDMDSDERATYHIAEAFTKFMKGRGDKKNYIPSIRVKTVKRQDKYGDECNPADHIRNAASWQYFERVWEKFETDATFDAEIFMESISKHTAKTTKIYPAQLSKGKYIDGYKSYRQSIKMRSNNKDEDLKRILTGIQRTYILIQRKTGVEKPGQMDFHDFFNTPREGSLISEGLLFCMQDMISPYYFAVSKAFLRAYRDADPDIRDEVITLDRLKDMSILVKTKDRVYPFVKKLFGDDIL